MTAHVGCTPGATGWRADDTRFTQVVASPLVRVQETAEIIASGLGCDPPELDPDWMEHSTKHVWELLEFNPGVQ